MKFLSRDITQFFFFFFFGTVMDFSTTKTEINLFCITNYNFPVSDVLPSFRFLISATNRAEKKRDAFILAILIIFLLISFRDPHSLRIDFIVRPRIFRIMEFISKSWRYDKLSLFLDEKHDGDTQITRTKTNEKRHRR